MTKRTSVFWAVTAAELALVVYALTSFTWLQAPDAAPDALLASAAQAAPAQR